VNFRSPEQQAYARLIEGALKPGPPLLAGAAPGLGKTHGYTLPLVASGRRIAVAMSTRQLIQQYLSSDAMRAAQGLRFKPAETSAMTPPTERTGLRRCRLTYWWSPMRLR
jgi:Rad3-related DNA helicase